ncbi:MAG: hypothetical protein N7Q72_05020 [Spiroplasma sp. Tabriz.8]|nr:hypothetical protein [Spiroplasma sp. Tabriz.8]
MFNDEGRTFPVIWKYIYIYIYIYILTTHKFIFILIILWYMIKLF